MDTINDFRDILLLVEIREFENETLVDASGYTIIACEPTLLTSGNPTSREKFRK